LGMLVQVLLVRGPWFGGWGWGGAERGPRASDRAGHLLRMLLLLWTAAQPSHRLPSSPPCARGSKLRPCVFGLDNPLLGMMGVDGCVWPGIGVGGVEG
jgi:hypothetical protein